LFQDNANPTVGVNVGVLVEVNVGVLVGVKLGVNVGVFVGVKLGVKVNVSVGVNVEVKLGVNVAVSVGVKLGVNVGVSVGVKVEVKVGVKVGVLVGVKLGVNVGVFVGVKVDVFVGVAVAAPTVWVLPVTVPPLNIAPCPVVAPTATIDELAIALLKVLFASPPSFRLNTNSNVVGWLLLTVTNPLRFTKVTDPLAEKFWFPSNSVSAAL